MSELKDCSELFSAYVHAPGFVSDTTTDTNEQKKDLDLDQLIQQFENRTRHWILNYAGYLIDANSPQISNDSGFAVLMILNAYPEMIAQLHGKSGDKESLYREGLQEIFPRIPDEDLDKVAKTLYPYLRSALAHMGFISERVILSLDYPNLTLCRDPKDRICIIVNPNEWYDQIMAHFQRYLTDLRNEANEELRNNFLKRMKNPI